MKNIGVDAMNEEQLKGRVKSLEHKIIKLRHALALALDAVAMEMAVETKAGYCDQDDLDVTRGSFLEALNDALQP